MMKVGDNTFPNLLALLTGLWAGERDGKGSETDDFKKKGATDREIDIDRQVHLSFFHGKEFLKAQ